MQSDAIDWLPHGGLLGQFEKPSRVSPDGLTLLFRSQEQLTSYDNEGVPMLYRYRVGDSVAGGTCNGGARNTLSCDANGTSPVGLFGSTSLDCPLAAAGIIAARPVQAARLSVAAD